MAENFNKGRNCNAGSSVILGYRHLLLKKVEYLNTST